MVTEIEARVAIEAAWLFLPAKERCTREQAIAFAREIGPDFPFRHGDQTFIIAGWLIGLLPAALPAGATDRRP